MVKILPFILLAIAFVILLTTLFPYYTLKVIENKTFNCPRSEWIDCMPGPGVPKSQCSPNYLKWANANCPNFKGAAL